MKTNLTTIKTEDDNVKRNRVSKANKTERRESKRFIQNQLKEDEDIKSDLRELEFCEDEEGSSESNSNWSKYFNQAYLDTYYNNPAYE